MEYAHTSHNRIVYASGLKALGLHSPRSAAPPTAHSGTFLRLLKCSAFLYRNRKNVVYNRNVKRQMPQTCVLVIVAFFKEKRNKKKYYCARNLSSLHAILGVGTLLF